LTSKIHKMILKTIQLIMIRKILLFFVFVQLYYNSACLAMKYTYCNFVLCQKCEENSKCFYQLKNIQVCPRCTLEYLSFYFSSQTDEAVKFYIKDIIFNNLNDLVFQKQLKFPWISISYVVNHKLRNEISVLKERKEQNDTCGLFIITNEILWKTFDEKNLFERRKCSQCSKSRFNLIKSDCCKSFICLCCILKVESRKCLVCQTEMYKTKKQLHELVNIICLTICKQFGLNANQKSINEAIKKKIILQDQKVAKYLGSYVKRIMDHVGFDQETVPMLWDRIVEPESEIYEKFNFCSDMILFNFIFAWSQVFFLSFKNPNTITPNILWVCYNMIYSVCASYVNVKILTSHNITDKNAAKVTKFISEIEILFIRLINFNIQYFSVMDIAQNNFFLMLLFTFIGTTTAMFASKLIQNALVKWIKKKQRYQFF